MKRQVMIMLAGCLLLLGLSGATIERTLKGEEKKAQQGYQQVASSFQSNKEYSVEQRTQLSTVAQIQQSQPRAELVVQMGHFGTVRSVAFSPDGKTLASGSSDRAIKLWDVASGAELRTLSGHSRGVNSVAFSNDGKTLASGSWDVFSNDLIKLWDVASGAELRTLSGHSRSVNSVAFSSDSKTLASGDGDGIIKLWDVASGKELRTLSTYSSLNKVAFSSNGKILASESDSRTIKLWDVAGSTELRTLSGHSDIVRSFAFSNDGKTLASGDGDGIIKLWDVASGEELRTLSGHPFTVWSVAFSNDGKTLASGSDDKTIKLWDVASGKELRTLSGHSFTVWSVAFSDDGKTLASGSDDKTIKLWDVASGKELRTLSGHSFSVNSVTFSNDGKTLAIGDGGNAIKLWDVASGTKLKTLSGNFEVVRSVAFSNDGKTLASGGGGGTIELWDVESGTKLRNLLGHYFSLVHDSLVDVISVAFSPEGKTLASGGSDRAVKLWDVTNGKELRTLSGHSKEVWSVAFSSDGKILASGSDDGTIKLWDVASGKELSTLSAHSRGVSTVAFSNDGKTLASGSGDEFSAQAIKLWDVASGRELRTLWDAGRGIDLRSLSAHPRSVNSVVFSNDGKFLVSGNDDSTIKLWDVASGREIRTFSGHSFSVNSVAFSNDGKTLASGSVDLKTKLWDVATGKELCSLIALDKDDWAVVTPDGRFDTSKIENTQGLHWVVSDDPLTPAPLEIFMRDYYEPKLLPRLMRCTRENNCNKEFKPVRNLTSLNRTQPNVKITDIKPVPNTDAVSVTVEVANLVSNYQRDGQNKPLQSGVFDVRLFRDGQLIGYAPANDGEVELNAEGKASLKFSKIKLPRTSIAQVEFSTYAFNADRVKSATDHKTYTLTPRPTPVKGRAYVIALGVNAYEREGLNLRYAANDARQVQKTLEPRLTAQGEHEEVVSIQLVSDYTVTLSDGRTIVAQDATIQEVRSRQKRVTENSATKAHLQAVLDVLAGRPANAALLKKIPNADKLRAARPEDLIIISASSHGYTDSNGTFYLVPSDTGTAEIKSPEFRSHCVSSDELSRWLRDVDAGELVLIVDACHSAAAVQGTDFKPGPMGSRGLGQLSYDKGMRILAATQTDNVALEASKVRQGLLIYALLQDGLGELLADYKPQDKSITLSEWLGYGVERVPHLYEEIKDGRIRSIREIVDPRELDNDKIQQPSLFDFARRRREVVLAGQPSTAESYSCARSHAGGMSYISSEMTLNNSGIRWRFLERFKREEIIPWDELESWECYGEVYGNNIYLRVKNEENRGGTFRFSDFNFVRVVRTLMSHVPKKKESSRECQ